MASSAGEAQDAAAATENACAPAKPKGRVGALFRKFQQRSPLKFFKGKGTSPTAAAAAATTAATATPPQSPKPKHQPEDIGATVAEIMYGRDGVEYMGLIQGGTCEACKVLIDGELKVVKLRRSVAQCEDEVKVSAIYRQMGACVPAMRMEEYQTRAGHTLGVLIQDFVAGKTLLEHTRAAKNGDADCAALVTAAKEDLCRHFLLDCLFANWDVVGGRGGDNIMVLVEDCVVRAVRVDNAGVLGWRAQGGKKAAGAWDSGGFVSEVHVMRDTDETTAAEVFQAVSDESLLMQHFDAQAAFATTDVLSQLQTRDREILLARAGYLSEVLSS